MLRVCKHVHARAHGPRYSDCVVPETLDESPAMYKDHAVVMKRSADTCDVVAHLKPVLNIKGF